MKELWAIFIPGPDEYHAAPSEAAAKLMAEKHNAAMNKYFAQRQDKHEMLPMVTAIVAKSPLDPEDHAEEMKSFDYAAWALEGGAA